MLTAEERQVIAAAAEDLDDLAPPRCAPDALVARLRAIAGPATPLTLAAALQDPRFKRREVVLLYREQWPPAEGGTAPVLGDWVQSRATEDDGITYVERRRWHARWRPYWHRSSAAESVDDLALACEIVPYDEADQPPRGAASEVP